MNITKEQLKDLVASAIKDQVQKAGGDVNEAKTRLTRQELKGMVREMMEKVMSEEETKDGHNYDEFFRTKMKEMFDTESLDDLSDEQRGEFFRAVDHDWKARDEKMDEQADDETERWHKFLRTKFSEKYGKDFNDGYDALPREERMDFLRTCRSEFKKGMSEQAGRCRRCDCDPCECQNEGSMCEKCGGRHDEMSECGGGYTKTTVMEGTREVGLSEFKNIVRQMIIEESASVKNEIFGFGKKKEEPQAQGPSVESIVKQVVDTFRNERGLGAVPAARNRLGQLTRDMSQEERSAIVDAIRQVDSDLVDAMFQSMY